MASRDYSYIHSIILGISLADSFSYDAYEKSTKNYRENSRGDFTLIDSFDEDDDYSKIKDQIFSLFQIDLENYLELKYLLVKQLKLQPSEIENFEYYELEYMIENHKKWMEKEKEAREAEEKGQKGQTLNNNQYMKDAQKMAKMPSTPTMPKVGDIKLPKF